MRRKVKGLLARYCPALLSTVQGFRRRRDARRERKIAEQIAPFRQEFADRCGWTVQSGIVRGLKYHTHSRSDSLLPRLVGCYEAEIHSSIEIALARRPSVLVDIGCEEGYFAVGLALRQPLAIMYAFDIEPAAQESCRNLARINGVEDRVVVGGECTPAGLQAILGEHSLVLCDCEGYELDIMDPVRVPALRSVDLVVELHDHVRADVNITRTVTARFADSHEMTLIGRSGRDESMYPCLEGLPPGRRSLAMYEPRMRYQQWAFLKSRQR